jgi:hypothetical protein
MHLEDLRWACSMYEQLTGYDASLAKLRERTGDVLDPYQARHRAALFEWLNSWACRQFALEHHATTASESLMQWADEWLAHLPAPDVSLTDLTMEQTRDCARAYDALRAQAASYRTLPSGKNSRVTYGATGAAKTLFALRPNVIPPWDDPIRAALRASGDLGSFRVFLTNVSSQLRSLAAEAGRPVSDLPMLVGRPDSTPPKLIDEYNWIVITKGLHPPNQ